MRHLRGFTLIEILVVMVIIGLLAGVALPRLFAMAQRYEMAAQRNNLLAEISNLGYRAYISGQAINLTSSAPTVAASAPLNLPRGWKIEAQPPIHYSFNGTCSGGKIALINPDGWREEFKLTTPQCLPATLATTQ